MQPRETGRAQDSGAHLLASLNASPLRGREAQLQQLDTLFGHAVEYQAPQLVTVVGTQGVGKSRLVTEWLQRLVGRHAAGTPGRPRVYRGKAQRNAGSYSLISRLLRDRFAVLDSDDEARRRERVRTQLTDVFADRRMAEVLHFLGRFLELRLTEPGREENAFIRAVSFGPDEARHEAAIARSVLRRFLELDAERSPLVLSFDDLHLGDDDSLTLLAELAQGLGGSPVVLIAAARPELFVRRPDWGQGPVDHTRIDLGPLPAREAEQLLRALLVKAEPLPGLLIDDVLDLTRGNPFFIEEVVRVFRGNGTITVLPAANPGQSERWRIDPVKAEQIELPMTVEEAIEARIAALSPVERDLLEKAATLGNIFWLGSLIVMSRLDEPSSNGAKSKPPLEERARLEAALEDLVERDYLLRMPDSSVPGETEFIFKHNLEHDLVAKLLVPDRARRYHLLAAEWLETRLPPREEQSGEQLEFQGSLYERGGAPMRAATAYLAAADKARARFANEAAIELYARGLRLYDADDALSRIDPLHNYGDVLQRAGRTKEALDVFQQMLLQAWRLDHHAKAGAAHGRIARLHRAQGDYPEAEAHLLDAITLFRQAADSRGVAAVEDDLGRVAYLRGDYPAALERHGRALDLRRALGHKQGIALSLHNLATVYAASGNPGEAVSRFSEALALRREIGDRTGVVQSLIAVATAWRDRADSSSVERALEVLKEALGLAREIGDRLEQAHILVRMGDVLIKMSRDAEASDHLAQAAELAATFGDRLLQSEAARLLGEVFLQLGDLKAARTEARRALDLATQVGSRPQQALAHRVLGAVLAKGGITDEEKAEADQHFQKAIAILGEVGAEQELGNTYQSYSHVLAERGDHDGSQTFAERAGEITQKLRP
jgi:tetratricopeptide (TPR) repeat protein